MIAQSGRSTSPCSGNAMASGASVSRMGILVRNTKPNSAFTGMGASMPSCLDEADCLLRRAAKVHVNLEQPGIIVAGVEGLEHGLRMLRRLAVGALFGRCAELLRDELVEPGWRWRGFVGAEPDVEAHDRQVDGGDAAEIRRVDLQLDADLVAAEELEPHDHAHPGDQVERIPGDEHVDVDIEPGADAGKLRRQRHRHARHERLWRQRKERLDRQSHEAEDRALDAEARQLRIVFGDLEVGVIPANRQDEVALVRRRVPDAEAEVALQAEDVGMDDVAVLRQAGLEEELLFVGGHLDAQLEVRDRADAQRRKAEQVERELVAELDGDDDLALDQAERRELDPAGDPVGAVLGGEQAADCCQRAGVAARPSGSRRASP